MFNDPQAKVLFWRGKDELNTLNDHLEALFFHGFSLLNQENEQGKTVMLLTLALKRQLKTFFKQPLEKQMATKSSFKAQFIRTLHSKDEQMTMHRQKWKMIVANILIAFTGLGLFAIAGKYVFTGQCFFNKTAREKQIESIEKEIETLFFDPNPSTALPIESDSPAMSSKEEDHQDNWAKETIQQYRRDIAVKDPTLSYHNAPKYIDNIDVDTDDDDETIKMKKMKW